MVNPGSFRGPRKEFLVEEKPAYKAAVTGGYMRDTLANIQCQFFKRFLIDMPLNVDPTPQELAAIDDDTPDGEDKVPNPNKLTPEEFEAVSKVFEEMQQLILFQKGVSYLCLAPGFTTLNCCSKSNIGWLIST
jgi:hypothetical protein